MRPNTPPPISPWARQALGPDGVRLLSGIPMQIIGASPTGPWTIRLSSPGRTSWEQYNVTDLLRGIRAALEWRNGDD